MRKLYLGLATLLLSGSVTLGYGADDGNYNPFGNSTKSAAVPTHTLTPKRAKTLTPISASPIKQASLTAQIDEISSDAPFEDAPVAPPPVAEDLPATESPTTPEFVPPQPAAPIQEEPAPDLVPIVPEQPIEVPTPQVPVPDPFAQPVNEEPAAQPPVIQEAPVVVPVPIPQVPVQEPAVIAPVVEEPVVEQPVIEQPAVKVPVIQVPQTMPTVEPAPARESYSLFQSELEQLRFDFDQKLDQLRKDSAKTDTKKGWSSPKFSGRIFLDSVNFMDSDRAGADFDRENAGGFRELRLGMSGTGYDSFDYKIEFGFNNSSGTVTLMDNWVGVKNVPLLGYFRAGYYKPEVGLYYPMGTTQVTMMEYATGCNVLGLGRKVGVSSEHLFANDRIRLFMGLFQNGATDRNVTNDDQGQIVNLRLTTVPVFEQEGKQLLHFGAHWEYVNTSTGTATQSATPGTFSWAAASLTTGAFGNEYSNRGGLEMAVQNGSFSARAEAFTGSFAGYNGGPSRTLSSAYIELGLFLTEGFRTYDLNTAWFGGVKTKHNFHPYADGEWNLVDSFGAWQAILQWSYVNMDDWRAGTTIGGDQTDLVLGLNWFWSPQMRMIFELVHSKQNTGVAHIRSSQDIFGTSLRYNW